MAETQPEVWLRGPQNEFPVLVQPIAFALQQAQEDVNRLMLDFRDDLLYKRPGNAASVAFHLQHLSGVLDRMFTYAENIPLKEAQLNWLSLEGKAPETYAAAPELVAIFNAQIETSLQKLKLINPNTLAEPRGVGRQQLPSTVFGLLIHAAEHTQRHVGQLLVTVKVLMNAEV